MRNAALLGIDLVMTEVRVVPLECRTHFLVTTIETVSRGKTHAFRSHQVHGHIARLVIHQLAYWLGAHRLSDLWN
jgi:hypothetical protein